MGKKTSIEKNSIIRVTIDDITDLGFGVGRVDGKVIFIADTVPGDVCDAKIIKDNSSYYVGRVEKLIEASIEREENTCCGNCKSCAYRLISYDNECARKEDGVRRLFSSDELKGIVTEPIIKSPSAERYRNKAQYPIAKKGDDYLVGFYAPKSHRVTPVDDCPLTPVVFSQIVKDLKVFFAKSNLSVSSPPLEPFHTTTPFPFGKRPSSSASARFDGLTHSICVEFLQAVFSKNLRIFLLSPLSPRYLKPIR